jgi:hypothetical protein
MTKTTTRFLTALVLAGVAAGGAWAQSSTAKPKIDSKKSRVETHSKAGQLAAAVEAAEDALTPEEMVIAERVYVGKVPCELGQFVTLSADDKMPGYFDVAIKNYKFHMFPVITSTGAIRLEDHRNGAVWLQLGNKSMLMSQKLGTRLADACVTPQQAVVAAAMEKAPPPNLLDGSATKPSVAAAGGTSVATVVTTVTTTTTTTTSQPGAPASAPAVPASAPATLLPAPLPAAGGH